MLAGLVLLVSVALCCVAQVVISVRAFAFSILTPGSGKLFPRAEQVLDRRGLRPKKT